MAGIAIQSSPNLFDNQERTGIFLDTNQNSVMLIYEDNMPAYYSSQIFTPVCETGECKPIYVNLYWKLNGEYLKYDQPGKEILTKINHEPFTQSDYKLLDEILRGPDPRYGNSVKPSPAESKKGNSSTVQSKAVFMKKSEMVDGISGATLPELKGQFVPGALYTTYTIWELAHSSRLKMLNHTRKNLFKEKYYTYFLENEDLGCRDYLLQTLAAKAGGKSSMTNTLMSIADTTNETLATYCINQLNYAEVELDTVQKVLGRKFFGESSLEMKKTVIQKWRAAPMKPVYLHKLSKGLNDYPKLYKELVYLMRDQDYWPGAMTSNLIKQIDNTSSKADQQILFDVLEPRRASMSKDEWKTLTQKRKKYKLESKI